MKNKDKKLSFRYFFYDFTKYFHAIGFLIWYRMKRIYASHEAKKKIRGGAMVISNHTGFQDPMILMTAIWYRRFHFVMLKDFFRTKVTSWIFHHFLCVPIDRENVGMDTIRTITDELKNDSLVCMFPEGRINTSDDGLAQFKAGMVLMAVRAGVPIVPVFVIKRDRFWHRQKVIFGEPVYTRVDGKMPSMARINEITELLWQKEDELRNIAIERGILNVKS